MAKINASLYFKAVEVLENIFGAFCGAKRSCICAIKRLRKLTCFPPLVLPWTDINVLGMSSEIVHIVSGHH